MTTEPIIPDINETVELCSVSTKMLALTVFQDRFWHPFSAIHDQIFDLIDGPNPRVAIAAPRGWGKTSIVALALIARYVIFRMTDFIVYINMSHDAAVLQTENLKRELVGNRDIRTLFGKPKNRSASDYEIDESFSKKAWVAFETLILPRGSQQQVRGILYKNSRPGLIVIDDLEDPETIENDDIRRKRKEWFHADVLKSVSRLTKDWKLVYIDTLKHQDSLLQELLDSDEWASLRLEACDDNYKSSAPDFVSDADIAADVIYHRKHAIMDVFYREFRNLPISTEDATFKQEYFRYYNLSDAVEGDEKYSKKTEMDLQSDQNIETVIIVDPAKTVKIHSAETAIVGIGIDLTSARLYIRDIISEKMYPDEIYHEMFGMASQLDAKVIGVEETSLNEFIKQPIKNEMHKLGLYFELVWLKSRGGVRSESKMERIKWLVPFYRQGHIYHNVACCGGLEAQLLGFPRSKLWDIMDATAYIIEMLEIGERYFTPPDDLNNAEAEYADLDYEDPVEEFRII